MEALQKSLGSKMGRLQGAGVPSPARSGRALDTEEHQR